MYITVIVNIISHNMTGRRYQLMCLAFYLFKNWMHFFVVLLACKSVDHRRLCRVKNMLAMYLKYHKAGLTPTTSVTSTAISSVKMAIGHKSLTNFRSEMIFLQGKPVLYIFLPSTPPYWQIILRFCWLWTPTWQQKGKYVTWHLPPFGRSRVLSLPYEIYIGAL